MSWPLAPEIEEALIAAAAQARESAYAPYSQFRVGAALLARDGTTYPGCNVENASYGLCQCAERTAVGTAICAGAREFVAIAVATGSSPPSPPCGMCRQVLAELAPDVALVLTNPAGERVRVFLREIFPSHFDATLLQAGRDAGPKDVPRVDPPRGADGDDGQGPV